MSITINHRWKSTPVFTSETAITIAEALAEAITAKADLSDADLSGADLSDADLRGADLSDADLRGADLRGADLRGADLSGADLSDADLRGADLSGADLRGADLSDADLRGAVLRDADLRDAVLRDAVLRGADLSDADLRGADLSDADLRGAVLRGAVLRGAVGFTSESVTGPATPVPVIEKIHQRVHAAITAAGCRLEMGQWHTCETTHCRAGWVVHLAGEEGKRLEDRIGTGPAAMRIYLESDPNIQRLPRFYEPSNEKAMADIIACAEAEKAAVGPL